MPTAFSTVTGALQAAARTDTSKAPNASLYGGKLHVERHKYVLTDAEITNDTVSICRLPKGAQVVPHLSAVAASGDPGTTLTMDIGVTGNADRFADGISLNAGGAGVLWSSGTLPDESHNPVPLTEETEIFATLTVDTLSNTRTLIFWVAYTLP